MDAITYLRKEHTKIRRNLKEISKISDEKKKKTKFNDLCKYLIRHETMEEKAWYPVLRKHPKLRDEIKHLISEEKSASKAIKKFKGVRFGLIWKLKYYKFRHDVDHHATEEEKKLFPRVRKALTKAELKKLGTAMRKFEAKLKKNN